MKYLLAVFVLAFPVAVHSQIQSAGRVDIIGFTNETTPMPASLVGTYLVDSQGRITGDDPTKPPVIDPQVLDHQCCSLREIPGLYKGHNRLDPDDNSGTYGNESTEIVGMLPTGTYTLVLFSTVTYPVHFMSSVNYGRNWKSAIASDGILPSGTTVSLTVNYNPEKVDATTVVKTVSSPILRADLMAAYQVGDVGDRQFVGALDADLAAGESALARGGRKANVDAIAALMAFIGEIDQVLKVDCHEKRPHKDEHHFFTKDMAESMIDDAWTLIVQLHGEDHRPHRGKMRARN